MALGAEAKLGPASLRSPAARPARQPQHDPYHAARATSRTPRSNSCRPLRRAPLLARPPGRGVKKLSLGARPPKT
jgi:hypothetical protein